MIRKLILAAGLALALASAAGAHGRWYATATETEDAIEAKYDGVAVARCEPLPRWARAQYGAESQLENGVRRWNHFYCGVATTRGEVCLAVAHHVGKEWWQVVLTSWHSRGCSPRQLR